MSRRLRLGRLVQYDDADWQSRWYWQDQQEDALNLHTPLAEPELPGRWERYLKAEQDDQLYEDRVLRRTVSRALADRETARPVREHQPGQSHDPKEIA